MKNLLSRKNIIIYLVLMASITIYNFVSIYITQKNIAEDFVVVDRSPLITFRFLEYSENDNGSFFTIVNTETGKKYENIFISKTCPHGNKKKPGILMKLIAVESVNYATNEKIYHFDRAYDYICTNKDMNKEDEVLLQKIQEAKEAMIKELIKQSEIEEQEEQKKQINK